MEGSVKVSIFKQEQVQLNFPLKKLSEQKQDELFFSFW